VEIDSGVGPTDQVVRRHLEKAVVPLVVIDDDHVIGLGTGTLISSTGVVLLAKHVVLDARARDREHNLYALVRTGETHTGQPELEIGGLLPVVQVWLDETFDVGYGLLQQMQDPAGKLLEHAHMPLNLRLPEVGQRVIAFGYQGLVGTITDGQCDYRDELYSSDDVVTEVFNERRDSVLLNFPSFHVEGDFKPGMSGGPIFLDGAVGIPAIVCSGSEAGYASGAMVWPSMAIPVNWGDVATFPDMLTFAAQGFIAAEGLERVEIEHVGDNRSTVTFLQGRDKPPTST
jgi:hypothetical protein